MSDLPEYVERNRASWDKVASQYEATGRRNWATNEPSWGIFGVPESQVGMLPDDLDGLDAIELGCGTAYCSAWLARRGGAAGGDRQLGRAARHGARPAARARPRLPAAPRERRARAVPRRQLRLRVVGVRREHLGRPVQVDP